MKKFLTDVKHFILYRITHDCFSQVSGPLVAFTPFSSTVFAGVIQ
jgi:hypothetical protein